MGAFIDLSGKQFGMWTVLVRSDQSRKWHCRCECGTEKDVFGPSLYRGESTGCGCRRIALTIERSTVHGYGRRNRNRSREYNAWGHAKQRCFDKNTANYDNYGGRGITMCDRWRYSFQAFLSDMGPCPSGLTLERDDVNGNYAPGNCRWATWVDQMNNMRSNHFEVHDGKRLTIAQWSREVGIPERKIRNRLVNLGWSMERATNG